MSTNKNITEAKAFLRKRLDAEQSMSRNLEIELIIFANKIINLYRKYGYTPDSLIAKFDNDFQRELSAIIKAFKEALYDDVELLSTSVEGGDKNSIVAYINTPIAGLTLTDRISDWVDRFVSSIKKVDKPFSSIPIRIGAAYGIDRLLRQTIADAHMHQWKNLHPNATGFIPHRGSSYPCDLCDEHAERFHPMSEYPSYGNWHPNCCCYFEFTTTSPVPL